MTQCLRLRPRPENRAPWLHDITRLPPHLACRWGERGTMAGWKKSPDAEAPGPGAREARKTGQRRRPNGWILSNNFPVFG